MEKMEQKYTNSLFIDSGAHGLYNEHVIKKKHREGYSFFESKEFWEYVDTYCQFIKDNKKTIDVFANVDAIFNPQITWKVQRYIENTYGLTPLPVIHYNTDEKWLKRYLRKGYDYIALGGLGQEATQSNYVKWADRMFKIICDNKENTPSVKVHGFALTSYRLMTRYPWYSVDSTTWLKNGSFGRILVPPLRQNKWVYDEQFYIVKVSNRKSSGNMIKITQTERPIDNVFLRYIEEKGFTLGASDLHYEKPSYVLKEGESFTEKVTEKTKKVLVETITERGLCNDGTLRCDLNAEYFVDLADNLPTWPWAFHINQQKTLL